MRVVTGGDGFIGANLVEALVAAGEGPVLVVDELTAIQGMGIVEAAATPTRYAAEVGASSVVDKHDFLSSLDRLGDVVEVFHLGACSDTTELDEAYLTRNNVEYSQELFRLCARRGVPFIYASSAATYGAGEQGYSDLTAPSDLHPLNPYGVSKNRFDEWALQQTEAPPRWAGVKYFNVFGPREFHKGRMASVALHASRQLVSKGVVKLFESHRGDYGHGEQKRDFVFVGDVVAVSLELARSGDVANGLYNAGTGTPHSFNDLAMAVCRAQGVEPRIEYIPMPEELRERYQYFTCADMARTTAATGVASTSLTEGVARYWSYLKNHELF